MKLVKWIIRLLIFFVLILGVVWYVLSKEPVPKEVQYGVSFNTPYVRELGLDWEEVYKAVLEDLGVKHLRLAAHWTMVEPENGEWNFAELDKQIELAEKNNADIVFSVGRRLPRWPECHVPEWAKKEKWEDQKKDIKEYIKKVIERYKKSPAIKYWQVENEPFLGVYAKEECGELDKDFLDEEIALVHELDPTRKVLVTDSGNLGTWFGAYKRGDLFGTSVYVYLWNDTTGAIETILPPETYTAKKKIMELIYGKKETILIELSAEPWLNESVVDADLSLQLQRMNINKFDEIIRYAKKTRLEKQYLWGAEWWYWMKVKQNHPEFWEKAKEIYNDEASAK